MVTTMSISVLICQPINATPTRKPVVRLVPLSILETKVNSNRLSLEQLKYYKIVQ